MPLSFEKGTIVMVDIRTGVRYAVVVDDQVVPAVVARVGPGGVAVRIVEVAVDPWKRHIVLDHDAVLRPWTEYRQLLLIQRWVELQWSEAKARQELECERRLLDVATWLAHLGCELLVVELLARLADGTLWRDGVRLSAGALEQVAGSLRDASVGARISPRPL